MGCCFSTGKVTTPAVSAAKIPPDIEEESVKEVVVQSVSNSVPDGVPSAPEISDSEELPLSLPSPEISHNKSDICSFSILEEEDDALSKPQRPLHPPPPLSSSASRRNNISNRVSSSPGGRNSPQGKLRDRRNVGSGPVRRSGLSDGSRRRSRSPATRGTSSARRSPMKKRQVAEEKVEVDVNKEEYVRDSEMSMECFIFL
ncbi:unnamed protein product [Cochlearia groenlandica]